jgi:hypothetical protein
MPPILSSIAIATAKAYGFTSGGIDEFTADFLVIAGGGGGGDQRVRRVVVVVVLVVIAQV